MPTIAGHVESLAKIRGTVNMLEHLRAFMRSDPAKYWECVDPYNWGSYLDRDQCEHLLKKLVNTAINRKAMTTDNEPGRRRQEEYQRDLRGDVFRIRHHLRNPRQRLDTIVTPELFKRYKHLIDMSCAWCGQRTGFEPSMIYQNHRVFCSSDCQKSYYH